ncbi:hypothetical protein GCM10027447_31520 [Glycomyces halotolerans]
MDGSDGLRRKRLRFLCENADEIRGELRERDAEDLFSRLGKDGDDVHAAVEVIGDLLDLHALPGWRPAQSRIAMGGLHRVESGRADVSMVCPRSGAARCSRSLEFVPDEHRTPPQCAITGAELRWDGDERLAD